MKKRITSLLLAAVMAFSLTGCGKPAVPESSADSSVGYPDEDGYAEGHLGDTMHSTFFDYTVNSAYTCSEYGDYTAQEGYEILVADVTIKNTFRESITMFDTDFQVQWNDTSDEAYDWPVTYYAGVGDTIGENVLPAEYELAINESRTGLLVFEIPDGEKDFSISYQEYFDDDTTGDLFFVYFTAEQK